jgi:hypothetical protein
MVAYAPFMKPAVVLLLLAGCTRPSAAPELGPLRLDERWVYFPQDLRDPAVVEKLIALMPRARRAGYTTILLEDPNFGRLPLMTSGYFGHLERIKKVAREEGLDLVPALFQIGHSENLLSQDPNLAEGVPVREALFVVQRGQASLRADPPVSLRPEWDHRDPLVAPDGTIRDPGGHLARVWQKVKVHPYRQYRVSVRFRTEGVKGTPRIVVLGGGRMLNFDPRGPLATQPFTEQSAVFNSLECSEVRIAVGVWDGETGVAQFADPRLEEIGLLNVLRRPGAPLVVRTDDGRPLEEGRDFERIADPGLGTSPRPGGFTEWHEPPVLRTSLPDGTRLRVSYYHALTFPDGGQMMICPSEPKTLEILRDQARRLHAIFHAKAYFMSHDEMRLCNWDDSCTRRGMTAGHILAENVRACIRILREVSPASQIYCWSDMFDPVHNAHDDYYLARGGMAGTWEGLDRDVIVATWFFDRRDESLAWFSGRGHRTLIAGYYDQKPERAREWLESARHVRGTIGIMYTSWYDHFEDLEPFAKYSRFTP